MDEINWIALSRIFDGTPTPDDQEWFAAWVSADPTRVTYAEQLRDAWTTAGTIPSRFEVHHAWETVTRAMDGGDAHISTMPSSAEHPSLWKPTLRTGVFSNRGFRWATVGLAAAVAGILLVRLPNSPVSTLTNGSTPSASSTVYATPPGKRATIELSDGTKVMLNAASTLEVSHAFGTEDRTVSLQGQAVFDVQHATATPFVVNTGATQTTVLGTVFGIRSYDSSVQVAVQSGKVAVTPCTTNLRPTHPQSQPCESTGRIVLQARDIAAVTSIGRVNIARDSDAEFDRAFSWTSGQLVFHDTPIVEALDELARSYDVKFVVEDSSLIRGHLTTTFRRAQLTEHDVHDLSVLLQARVKQHGNTITIRPIEERR